MLDRLLPSPERNQVIALAGIFQACGLVDQYARQGTGNSATFDTAMFSLLQQNPDNTEAVYRNIGQLENGFTLLGQMLTDSKSVSHAMVLRYVVGVLYIARKIYRNDDMMNKIGQGIEAAHRQADHFELTHANVIANVADLYQNTISTLKYRIQVQGVAANLQQQSIANRIRCLLFSAVRSAVLWQQLGGKRYHLMVHRRQLAEMALDLKKEAFTNA